MTTEWTDRELEGIELLLLKLCVNTTEETMENNWLRCHEQVIFNKPLGNFEKQEWRELGEKLDERNLVKHGCDYAWDVNYGRLVPLLRQQSVSIRMRRGLAESLLKMLSIDPSETARDAGIIIERALDG
jgi:hypothetical protein